MGRSLGVNILWGIAGILVVLGIAFLISANRKAIRPRPVLVGLTIQFYFAFLVLKWPMGRAALQWFSSQVEKGIGYADQGIRFLFGPMLEGHQAPVFALQVLPVIIFFASLIGVLYYLGIMQWIIQILGGTISWLMGTSKVESLTAVATVFLGQSESPILIRPYLARLTSSELFAVMTGGFTSVAGSVLVGYSLLGVPLHYLLAASIMAAPAGLVMAKIVMPETETPLADEEIRMANDTESVNVIDAAARGAIDGLKLALNVGALLLAFIGLIALINGILGGIGNWVGVPGLSMQKVLGYLFAPIAFVVGVPWSEAIQAGGYIGQKLILNEFVAYTAFGPQIPHLSEKTVAIVTFALCGFANLSSIAIQIGVIGSLAPNRRSDVARFGLRAMIAGMMGSLLSAAMAGMLV
jgi:CNT family concentrative nucleoside transporter